MYAGCAACGSAIGVLWVWRDRALELAATWWLLGVPAVLVALMPRWPSRPPKSAAHPALRIRRHPSRPGRSVRRSSARAFTAPNVFVDGDSLARTAWPTAELAAARRWGIDASERIAAHFGTDIAVVLGPGAEADAGRANVRVQTLDAAGSMHEAVWQLVVRVDPRLPMLMVTDDETVARLVSAHGVGLLACRRWMTLSERLDRSS